MFSRTMRTAVLQATALFAISMLFTHHYTENMFDQVWENEGWQNMTQAFNNTSASKIPKRPTLDAGNMNQTLPHYLNNASTINGTQSTMEKSVESFYLRRFPREIFVYLVISSLQYWWFLALEKKWPVRPRYNDVSYQQEEKFDDNEDREEKVVKKWIAQGRVKRASLNWCNTFLKWVLDLTIGRLWYHVVEHVMRETIKWRSLKLILSDLKSHLTYNFIGDWFLSPFSLADLIGFIVVPAHHRVVFLAGVELVATIFLFTLARVFATWAIKTEFAQTMMRNITENAGNPRHNTENFPKFNDEL